MVQCLDLSSSKDLLTEVANGLGFLDSWKSGLDQLEYIELKSGRIITPDEDHIRLKFGGKHLLIQYGHSVLFGARLGSFVMKAYDCFAFEPNEQDQFKVFGDFRQPQINDMMISANGDWGYITDIRKVNGRLEVLLHRPLTKVNSPFSFCDAFVYNKYKDNCILGFNVGRFMRFIPNTQSLSKHDIFHEKINYKKIKRIKFK